MGHWDAWDDGAIVADRETGLFAHPDKVHRLDYKGEFFQSRGPFTVPRSAQGHPVLIQAGQSGRGQRFAARWAECVFVAYHGLEQAQRDYASFKSQVAAVGRDPEKTFVCAGVYPDCRGNPRRGGGPCRPYRYLAKGNRQSVSAVGSFELRFFQAADRQAFHSGADRQLDRRAGHARPHPRELGDRLPTPRDFINITRRGTFHDHPRFVGSPKDVADGLEEWFSTRACDGFVVAASHVPGAYEDFSRLVVPELQRRGLFHPDYTGTDATGESGARPAGGGAWHMATNEGR